jgi:DNA-binding response OmpR family regulator
LVEDEPLIREMIIEELGEAGFEIMGLEDGNRAIAELDADATRFKALITDISLPAGPEGWEIGRRARELVPDMPVIYITADSTHDWASKGVPNSVLIAKPFAPAQLITMVSTLIGQADALRAHRPDTPDADG